MGILTNPMPLRLPRNEHWESFVNRKLEGQHFMRLMGFDLTHREPGYIEGQAPLTQPLMQQDGILHGGVTSSVADIVTGFAAFSLCGPFDRVVTADLKISYLAPGKGTHVFARGWVVKPGKRLSFCEGEVYVIDEGGKLSIVAKASALMAIIVDKDAPTLT